MSNQQRARSAQWLYCTRAESICRAEGAQNTDQEGNFNNVLFDGTRQRSGKLTLGVKKEDRSLISASSSNDRQQTQCGTGTVRWALSARTIAGPCFGCGVWGVSCMSTEVWAKAMRLAAQSCAAIQLRRTVFCDFGEGSGRGGLRWTRPPGCPATAQVIHHRGALTKSGSLNQDRKRNAAALARPRLDWDDSNAAGASRSAISHNRQWPLLLSSESNNSPHGFFRFEKRVAGARLGYRPQDGFTDERRDGEKTKRPVARNQCRADEVVVGNGRVFVKLSLETPFVPLLVSHQTHGSSFFSRRCAVETPSHGSERVRGCVSFALAEARTTARSNPRKRDGLIVSCKADEEARWRLIWLSEWLCGF